MHVQKNIKSLRNVYPLFTSALVCKKLSSSPLSETLTINVLPVGCKTKFHIHKKNNR